MIKLTSICQYCGEEYWGHHSCPQKMEAELKQAQMIGAQKCTERPQANEVDTWDYVIADILERNEMGREKYGVTLKPNTKEDMLQHAYEEALDLTVYLKTEILKRKYKGE